MAETKSGALSLLSSRKTWVGIVTVVAAMGAVLLRALDKIPHDALIPTMTVIGSTGIMIIGSIAWEDSASKGAGGAEAPPPAPAVTNAVTVNPAPASHAAEGATEDAKATAARPKVDL